MTNYAGRVRLHIFAALVVLSALRVEAGDSPGARVPHAPPSIGNESAHGDPTRAEGALAVPADAATLQSLARRAPIVATATLTFLGPTTFPTLPGSEYPPPDQIVWFTLFKALKGHPKGYLPVRIPLHESNLAVGGLLPCGIFYPGRQFLLFLREETRAAIPRDAVSPPGTTSECRQCQIALFNGWLQTDDSTWIRYHPIEATQGVYMLAADGERMASEAVARAISGGPGATHQTRSSDRVPKR